MPNNLSSKIKLPPSKKGGFDDALENQIQKRAHKEKLVGFTTKLLKYWMLFIAFIVTSAAFCPFMQLSDEVLIALLVTTTGNIIALVYGIVKGLFAPA